MKKILGAALALSLIGSAAFAEITVSGRGYVETHVFNYKTDTNGENGTTKLFDNWDTGDSDVFISGDINGIAGAMLNIDFGDAAKSGSPTPVKVGDKRTALPTATTALLTRPNPSGVRFRFSI